MPASSILLDEKDFKLNDTTTFMSSVKSSIGSGINVLLNKKKKTNLNSESNQNTPGTNQGPNDKNSKSQEFKTQEPNNNLRDKEFEGDQKASSNFKYMHLLSVLLFILNFIILVSIVIINYFNYNL